MPNTPSSPWHSARLHYRAIRPSDTSLFRALSTDPSVYLASTHETTKLPGPDDAAAASHKKPNSDEGECLLSAVICLPRGSAQRDEPGEQKNGRFVGGNGVGGGGDCEAGGNANQDEEDGGIAIGQIHSAPTSLHEQCHRTMEIALDILPAYQGKGYGSEAINWALDFGFRRAGLHSVRLRAFGWNTGAIRLYERLGFVIEGREREAVWYDGQWWDSVTLGMLEGEWRARQGEGQER